MGGATMNLKGKTALVTGGAARIGKAICEALAAKAVNIVTVNSRRCGVGRLRGSAMD